MLHLLSLPVPLLLPQISTVKLRLELLGCVIPQIELHQTFVAGPQALCISPRSRLSSLSQDTVLGIAFTATL